MKFALVRPDVDLDQTRIVKAQRASAPHRASRSSVLLTERWITGFVAAICWPPLSHLGAHLEHDPLDAAPDREITTQCAPRR